MQSEINADDFFSMNEEEQEAQAPVPVAEEPAAKPALSADEFFSSIEQEERDASKAILSKDPALANRERIAAQQMETTRLDAATHLDEYEGIANRNATREKLKDAPVFTGYLANNQSNAPILQNDIDGFIDIEKRMAKFGLELNEDGELDLTADATTGWQVARNEAVTGFVGGDATIRQGIMWANARDGLTDIDDAFKKCSAEYDKAIEASQGSDSFIAEAGKLVGSVYAALTNSVNEFAAGSSVMVGAGMAAGLAAPAMAPLLGAAAMGGSAGAMYKAEGGLSYKDMIENGARPEEARLISQGVGLVNALIEVGGVTVLGKAAAPLLRMLTTKYAGKTAAALAAPEMSKLVLEASKVAAKGVAAEVTTEVMQELVNVAGESLANEFANAKFDDATAEALFDRLSEVAIATMKGTMVLGALGMGPTIVASARKVYKAREAEDFFNALHENMSKSEAAELAPEVVADAVQQMSDEARIGKVYVDAAEFYQVIKDHGITMEQLEQTLPGIGETLAEKALNKEDLVFQTGEYASKIAGTELGKSLTQHMRLDPDALSVADAAKVEAETKRLLAASMNGKISESDLDRSIANMADDEYKAEYDKLKAQMYESIKATGSYSDSEAKANAKLGAWQVANLVRRAGLPASMIAKLAPTINAPVAQEEAEEVAEDSEEVVHQLRTADAPKKTRKVYKLMKVRYDKSGKVETDDQGRPLLYPLFIDNSEPLVMGQWYDADAPGFDLIKDLDYGDWLVDEANGTVTSYEDYKKARGITNKNVGKGDVEYANSIGARWMRVSTTTKTEDAIGRYGAPKRYYNLGINGRGSVSEYAYRPGYHAASAPSMIQIGYTADKNIRRDDQVWVEAEVPMDHDYNLPEYDHLKTPDRDMIVMPKDGTYTFTTNPTVGDDGIEWVISGAFRPVRLLSDAEVNAEVKRQNAEELYEVPATGEMKPKNIPLDWPRALGRTFNAETMMLEGGDPNFVPPKPIKKAAKKKAPAKKRSKKAQVLEQKAAVKVYSKSEWRVLKRTMDNLTDEERAVFDEYIDSRPDAARIRGNLERLKDTPWAKQAIEAVFVRASIIDAMAGREPRVLSMLQHPQERKILATLKKHGKNGLWRVLQSNHFLGHAGKPGNNVNSTFINCNPSMDCAKFCYATEGLYNMAPIVVKSELVSMAVELDPIRAAQETAREYKGTAEFYAQKALRLFDKGDIEMSWLPFIEELNKQGVRAQIFSKRPEILRQVSDFNLRLLSIDKSNMHMAAENPDLKVAFVFSELDQIPFIVDLFRQDRFGVILPVVEGKKYLDEETIEKLREIDEELSKHICPIDSKRSPARTKANPDGYYCPKCDKNGGAGCFRGSVTKKVLEAAKKAEEAIIAMQDMSLEELARAIETTKKEYDNAIKSMGQGIDSAERVDGERGSVRGSRGGAGVADVSNRLDELVQALLARVNTGAERGQSQGVGGPSDAVPGLHKGGRAELEDSGSALEDGSRSVYQLAHGGAEAAYPEGQELTSLKQIIGEKGIVALDPHRILRDALAKAKRLHAEGVDAYTIFYDTGWQLGPDKQWKYEIDDLTLKEGFKYGHKEINGYKYLSVKLEDLINHDDFFTAYSEFKDVDVVIAKLQDANGHPLPAGWQDNTLFIDFGEWRDGMRHGSLIYTIAHELQHAIQEVEGFALGGSPADIPVPPNWTGTNEQLQKYRKTIQKRIYGEAEAISVVLRMKDPREKMKLFKATLESHGLKEKDMLTVEEARKYVGQVLKQIAWHGSPYRFTKFLLEKIGTGEGAQAHGWGLYFALNEETAQGYRERLKFDSFDNIEEQLNDLYYNMDLPLPFNAQLWNTGSGWDDLFWTVRKMLNGTYADYLEEWEEFGDVVIYKGWRDDLDEFESDTIEVNDFLNNYIEPQRKFLTEFMKVINMIEEFADPQDILNYANSEGLTDEFKTWFDDELRGGLEEIASIQSTDTTDTLYKVDIPEDGVMLNEQKTLKDQPEFVQKAIAKLVSELEVNAADIQDAIGRALGFHFSAVKLLEKYSNGYADNSLISDALEPVLRGALKQVKDEESKEAYIRKVTPSFEDVLMVQKFESDTYRTKQIDGAINAILQRAIYELDRKRSADILAKEDPTGEKIYDRLKRRLGSPKAASLKLLEYGIKGIRYNGYSDGPCAVVFDEDAVNILEMAQAELDEFLSHIEQANMVTTGSYSITNNSITLTPKANLTTFAHEMGHWYLETLFAIYDQTTSASVRADVETMLKDFGLNSIEAWYKLPMKDREVLHERFAFYVEQYFAEGKAPTKETRGFFQRFGAWIRAWYSRFGGGAKEELNKVYRERFDIDLPEMSDEVRRVLDRMMAAESSIKQAEAAEGIMPLFKQKPEDMDDRLWQQLMQESDDADSEATDKVFARMARDEKWYTNARSKKLRDMQRAAKETRNAIRAKVEKEVDDTPEMKLLNLVKANNMRLSEDDLRMEGVPAESIATLRKAGLTVPNYTAPGKYNQITLGALRQWAAFIYKADTNQQVIKALLIASDREGLIEELTTQRCLKDHSELFDPKKMDAAVTEAIHNEARSRFIATELSYLANDKEGRSRIYREAARRVAEQMINSMPIGSIRVRKFVAAEARASRAAFEALAKGDRYAAVLNKRAQLVQHEAALMAIEIEKEMRRVADLKSRIFRADKKLAKTHDIDIINIARYVLTNEGLGKTSPDQYTPEAAMKYVDRLKKYDPDKFALYSAMLDKHAYKGAIDFSRYTVQYAMEVIEDVQMLYRQARDAKTIMLDGKRQDREQVVDELIERFNMVDRSEWDGGKDRVISASGKLEFAWMSFKSKMIRIENWCHAMDGSAIGPFFKYIYLPIANAAAKFRNLNNKTQEALVNVLKPMIGKWANVRDIQAPELGYTFATKAELIGALLHTGNASNKAKLLLGGRGEGKPWARLVELQDGSNYTDTTQWDGFISRCMQSGIITKEDMDVVQQIWDLTESTKPVAQAAFKALYGTYFEEVEAEEIVTPWGNYRGGYVPAITDKYLVPEKTTQEEAKRITQQDFVSQMPVHQPSFSRTRVPNYTKPLALDVGLLCGHIQEVLKFATMAPVAQEVAKILSDKRFAEPIEKHDPTWISQMLVPWLKRSFEQTVSDGKTDMFSSKLNQLRGIAGMNIMCAHIVNALQQWTGLSIAATKVDPRYMAKAQAKLIKGELTPAHIMGMSPYMMARLKDRAFEFQSQIERIARTTENVKQAKGAINKIVAVDEKLDAARDWIGRHGYFIQTAMQFPIDTIVWGAAYQQGIDQGMSSEDAVANADSIVRTTQSAFDPENVSEVETGSALYRCFLVFYNYFNMQLNLLGEKWEGAKHTKKYGKFALDSMLIVAIPSIVSAILTQMISGFDTGDDDEWDTYDTLRLLIAEPIKNVIAMAPFLGGAVTTGGAALANADVAWAKFIWGEDPYQGRMMNAPAFDALATGGSSLIQWMKAAEGDDFNARSATRGTLDLLSVVTRMPLGALKKPAGWTAGYLAGEIEPESIDEVVRGLISGKDVSK